LIAGEHVDGLAQLDVEAMLNDLQRIFPGAVREENGASAWLTWESQNREDSFQVEWTRQFLSVTCRHVHTDDMNRIIDWGATFACRLYDPQTGERFGG
jgi:hypothetical protein